VSKGVVVVFIPLLFRCWLDTLRARGRGKSRPARSKPTRKHFSPLLLEPLETRLTPAGLFDRLTSPVAASYLSTSDTVLVAVIGQLEGPGASGRVATTVGNLNVLQRSLDQLLHDLGAPVTSSSVLQGELNGMVSQCNQILNMLANQGDISINLELSGGTLSLRSAVQDVRTALTYLAGTTSLSKLPSVSKIFASGEAGLCNVLGSSAYSAASTSTTFAALAAAATTTTYLYVDQNNPNASDTGPGSATQPFKTIQAGANKAAAGTTVMVSSGTYNEKVTIKNSGTATAPIVFTTAPGAYVTVTGQANGFYDSGKSYVTIHGFTVTGTTNYGIYVYNTSNVTIDGNDVSYAGHPVSGQTSKGIYINLTTDSTVSNNRVHHNTDSGIYLTNGATRITIVGNETYANASQYTRQAPGIDLRTSGNTVYNNVSHDNEDTGIQLYAGAANNLVCNNIIYNNGDHGIDVSYPTGNILVSNSVYHNVTAGINMEGSATGTTLANNISVDNGINSPRTKRNIRVDANSQSGTTLDYDEVFLSVSGQVQFIWGTTFYYSLATFHSATSQETHGLQADPKWVAPASGNIQLLAGSPAIDSANSGATGESATDVAGNPRVDDPATPNTGAGPRSYDDRGAYEYQPPATISGQVFQDTNGHGSQQAGESGLSGWTVYLDANKNGSLDAGETSTVTNISGQFTLSNLSPGTYTVRQVLPTGWAQTTANPADITVSSGALVSNVNFGDFQKVTLSGLVFQDSNGDGSQQAGESGLSGQTVQLLDTAGNVLASASTDSSGAYAFANLGPGTYRVRQVLRDGWTQTTADPGDLVVSSGVDLPGILFGAKPL
jgi:parallel beta-helix repeat protein